jgi:hypothetical protein
LCVLFAATYPERTAALVLFNSSPRFVRNPQLPWLPTRAEQEAQAEEFERHWGESEFMSKVLRSSNPGLTEGELPSHLRALRVSVSPGSAAGYVRMNMDVDVCDVLSLVRVPTLVMHRSEGGGWGVQSGRYLAEHITGSRFVELPGADFMPGLGDQDQLFAELERFLADAGEGKTEVETDPSLRGSTPTPDGEAALQSATAHGASSWKDTTRSCAATFLGSAESRSIRRGTVSSLASTVRRGLSVAPAESSTRCRSSVLRYVPG